MAQVVIDAVAATSAGMGALNGKSTSDTTVLRTAFAGSPIHAGRVTDASQKAELLSVLENTALVTPDGTFNMTFGDAADLADVETGGGGLPASSFVPNPSSSPSGLPSDQPAPPDGYGQAPSNSFGTGPTADAPARNPSISSPAVLERTLARLR